MAANLNIQVSTQRGLAISPVDEYNMESYFVASPGPNNVATGTLLLPVLRPGQSVSIICKNPSGTIVYPPAGGKTGGASLYAMVFNEVRIFIGSGNNYIVQ